MGPNDLQQIFGKYAEQREIDGRAMLCIDGAGFKELSDIDDFEFATIVLWNLMHAYLRKHDLEDEGADCGVDGAEKDTEPAPVNEDAMAAQETAE